METVNVHGILGGAVAVVSRWSGALPWRELRIAPHAFPRSRVGTRVFCVSHAGMENRGKRNVSELCKVI